MMPASTLEPMNAKPEFVAAFEMGGTKIVCGIGNGEHEIVETHRIETTTAEQTLQQMSDWLSAMEAAHGTVAAIGIGSFGPLDLQPQSKTYGFITSTPKPGWQHTDVVGFFRSRFAVPIGFDTDVNAAVLAEHLWGAGQGLDPLIYITVGTGVGGGILVNGKLVHGTLHPEIGHLNVSPPINSRARHPECQCPFHRSCVEGYVSGSAIAKRWGAPAHSLLQNDSVQDEIADVMARALMNLILTLAPRRIILGGGVMQPQLLPLIRATLLDHLNGYLSIAQLGLGIDEFIVPPGLGAHSGLLGSLALGLRALAQNHAATSPTLSKAAIHANSNAPS